MSSDKEQLQALLADYVEGSLDERQIDEAEAYLAANPAVRTVVDRLMIDSEALRALPRQRAAVDFSEDFRAQAERDLLLGDAVSSTRKTPSFGGPMFALAAMLVVGLSLGAAGYYLLAYRPATNLEFAKVAAEQVARPEMAAAPGRDARGAAAVARAATGPAAESSPAPTVADAMPMSPAPAPMASAPRDEDGKTWDRVFASKSAAAGAEAATLKAEAKVEAETMALPDDVRAAIAARTSSRGALVVVVDDPASIDATRDLVRAAIMEYAAPNRIASNAANNVSNNAASPAVEAARADMAGRAGVMSKASADDAMAGGAPSATTTAPAAEIASDVPASTVRRVRELFGENAGAHLYDVAPPADASPRGQEAESQQMQQQASGVFRERADPTTTQAEATIDVYVVARSSAATRPTK